MSGTIANSVVGSYYQKFPFEESLGPIFIRKHLDNYHVCVQDEKYPNLYRVVVDCRDPLLAQRIKKIIGK